VLEQTLRADVQPLGTEPPPPLENFQMAAIVMVAAPIIAIYPFVQKYFVKGILSGAVKG
jgi:ABC-type glycerol-3-phosphate transport system permease component